MLGFGMTQILRDIGTQLRRRSDMSSYPLQVFASCSIFFFILMWIWGFSVYVDATWTLFSYLLLLMPATALALSAQLICLDPGSARSPRRQYENNCRPLYLIIAAVPLVGVIASVAKSDYVDISYESLIAQNSLRLAFAALIASLSFIKRPAYHWFVLASTVIGFLLSTSSNMFVLRMQ